MATPNGSVEDIFSPAGRLRTELLADATARVLKEATRYVQVTRWDSLRSPHIFMGLLALPDDCIRLWGERLGADLPRLLQQFQELFYQDDGECDAVVCLNREFLSDNVIRLLREAYQRALEHQRCRISPMDLLISLFTTPNSIVAECFERVGVTAAKLTELAVMAEHSARTA